MARVYSAQLFHQAGIGSSATVALGGPDMGFVWVLRHATVVYSSAFTGPARGFEMFWQGDYPLIGIGPNNVVQNQPYDFSMRHVVNAGELLTAFSADPASPGWMILCSGYELALP